MASNMLHCFVFKAVIAIKHKRYRLKVLTKTNDSKVVELFEQESNLLLTLNNF